METLPLEDYRAACDLFAADVFDFIAMEACVKRRRHEPNKRRDQDG
jgi:hypothetical protein